MKCFYHDDADGKCAGFMVRWGAECTDGLDVEFKSINYNDRFPMDTIRNNEQIWIVDFSIPVDDMKELLKITSDVTWIDHHDSSIKKYKDFGSDIKGIRYDGISGCELTFAYIYKMTNRGILTGKPIEFNKNMLDDCPTMVRLIGDYDVWKFDFEDTKAFNKAFLFAGQPVPERSWWGNNLTDSNLKIEIERGETLIKFTENLNFAACNSWSYETDFEGYRILVCNSTTRTSELFGERINDYPFVSVYTHDGEQFIVSLYSVNMDVNHIAEKYNGGGHKRACGFVIKELPFKKEVKI